MFFGWSRDILGMHLGNCITMQPVSFEDLVDTFGHLQELTLAYNCVRDHGESCPHAVLTALPSRAFQP